MFSFLFFFFLCVATVVNSCPANITVRNIFIYGCEVPPNDAPLALSNHCMSDLTSGQGVHRGTMHNE